MARTTLTLLTLLVLVMISRSIAYDSMFYYPTTWSSWNPWLSWYRCQVGEIFRECESSNCGELKCWQLLGWEQYTEHRCNLDCVSKCFCRPGLYRNRRGRCVKPWHCPQYKYRVVFNWTNVA
uniref:TIL domain containing protein n=1 Tax=Rhipicephalus appendiculatus TaxID=34631 RepID=A0A131YU29_RHIAP